MLQEYIIQDKGGNIESFNLVPMEIDVPKVLITSADILILALKVFSKKIMINFDVELRDIQNFFDSLYKKYPN